MSGFYDGENLQCLLHAKIIEKQVWCLWIKLNKSEKHYYYYLKLHKQSWKNWIHFQMSSFVWYLSIYNYTFFKRRYTKYLHDSII